MIEQLEVRGRPLFVVGAHSDLTWSTRWPGGSFEVSWAMEPGVRYDIRRGDLVRVMLGAWPLWAGEVQEPNYEDGTYTAIGMSRVAEQFIALDASLNVTTGVRPAINNAITRGWDVTLGASVPILNMSESGSANGLSQVSALLDLASDEEGRRWVVGGDRVVQFAPDPLVPSYYLRPGVVRLSPSDGEYASHVFVRYIGSGGGGYETAVAFDAVAASRYGRVEFPFDATPLGPISATRAQKVATGILAKARSRLGWASGVDVSASDLITPGGLPADLRLVRAGQMVRLHGLYEDARVLSGLTYLDVVLGSVSHAAGSGLATLEAVNTQPDTFVAALEKSLRGKTK